MKKVLALVLAAAMALSLATVAFAAPQDIFIDATNTPGTVGLCYAGSDILEFDGISLNMVGATKLEPSIKLVGGAYADDYNITATVKKGSDIVKASVASDKTKVTIETIPNWSWTAAKRGEFEVNVKVSGKKASDLASKTFIYKGEVKLGAQAEVVDINKDPNDDVYSFDINNSLYLIKSGGMKEDLTLNFVSLTDKEVYMEFTKLYEQGNINLAYDAKPTGYKDIQKANIDAELSFINFLAKPEFANAGKLVICADKDEFVYEIVDGKIAASKMAWDDSVGAYSMRTNVLGAYVVSDKELTVAPDVVEEEENNTPNPGTGANDMVNVAVAMAVVSLAAAGAVAFKRASK